MIAARKQCIITFLSDFGVGDWFVPAVKGEILTKNPGALIIDITHALGHFSLREAAFILKNTYRSFPEGTVHLAIVDPGVGSPRRAIIACSRGHYFVGPDNGLFSYVYGGSTRVYAIREKRSASRTFHARDIFAPAAARLSLGIKPRALGVKLDKFVRFAFPPFVKERRIVRGEVIYIDRFGNLITNMPNTLAIRRFVVKDKYKAPAGSYYGEAMPGGLIAPRGSCGYYEIASYRGDAARKTGAKIGTKVIGYL
jgi:S-adenosylmethionine hydrolase